jgi:DNA polymerase I-like protein with 3'-5' exonuclease and polymerase domains
MKSIRETFLPDEGCVFVRADLSQVEDRVGKMYCGSPRMVELANRKPWEYDAHTENAKDIFGKNEIDKTERYLGKKCVHASWRQMAGDKMSESVSKDTDGKLFIPPKKCQQLIDAYLAKNPEIEEIYFPFCEQQIKDVEICYNSWGRPFDVRDLRHDAELNRKVYSFYPQSECADWTNMYGVLPGHYYMWARYGKPLNMQIHDEIVASVPLEEAWDFAVYIKQAIEQTREIPAKSGLYLTVPTEITIGTSLYGGVEFEDLPGKEAFIEKAKEGLGL